MTEHACCPLCSARLSDSHDVKIDLDSGFILRGRHVIQLTNTEFEIFLLLWNARPKTFSVDAIMSKIYWRKSSGEVPENKIVDIYIHKARKKLKKLNIEIQTVWGTGYRIISPKEVTND